MNNCEQIQDSNYNIYHPSTCKEVQFIENSENQNDEFDNQQNVKQYKSQIRMVQELKQQITEEQLFISQEEKHQQVFLTDQDNFSIGHQVQCVQVQGGTIRKKSRKETTLDDLYNLQSEEDDNDNQFKEFQNISGSFIRVESSNEGRRHYDQNPNIMNQPLDEQNQDSDQDSGLDSGSGIHPQSDPEPDLNHDIDSIRDSDPYPNRDSDHIPVSQSDFQQNFIFDANSDNQQDLNSNDSSSDGSYSSSEEEEEEEEEDLNSDDSQFSEKLYSQELKRQNRNFHLKKYHKITSYFPVIYTPFNCCICLELQALKTFRYKCSHRFHAVCINFWIQMGKQSCPLCRKYLVRTHH